MKKSIKDKQVNDIYLNDICKPMSDIIISCLNDIEKRAKKGKLTDIDFMYVSCLRSIVDKSDRIKGNKYKD